MLYFCLHANFLKVLTHNRATIKLINQIGVLVTEVLVLFGYSRELPNQLLGFQIPTKMQIKQFVNQMRLLSRPVCQEWLGLCKLVK